MPPSNHIDVSAIGEMVRSTFVVEGREIKLWMSKKDAARYVLQLQTVLRGMNGEDPFPDHPGWGDATQSRAG